MKVSAPVPHAPAGARASVSRSIKAAVLLAALGYFVDIYDLILFSIVRVKSLQGLGLGGDALLSVGVLLLNMQMGGMLLGGILWGVLGDKKGRLSVLFGSIFLYSVANLANGLVSSVPAYAAWRFIAGVGLAGELGAGVTLVSELMDKESRGYGAMIVAGVGICGGIVAGLIGDYFAWRTAYFIGAGLGLALLALRIGVYESGMFNSVRERPVMRGSFKTIFKRGDRIVKYLCSILIGIPIWYVIGVLITFSPEFGKAFGFSPAPNPARAVMYFYAGSAAGAFLSGSLSQFFRTRKRTALGFILATAASVAFYLLHPFASLTVFYALCLTLGVTTGYWAVFVTMASEQFGTNIRATVTTTAPNFVRGATVPITYAFKSLKAPLGLAASAGAVGAVCITLSLVALTFLDETYAKDLDYCEE